MVSGTLTFEGPASGGPFRFVRIFVEDTRRAGADAVLIAEQELTLPENFDLENDMLPFAIDVDGNSDGMNVRAHAPAHDGRDIKTGDMITMGAIPANGDAKVTVVLKPVR